MSSPQAERPEGIGWKLLNVLQFFATWFWTGALVSLGLVIVTVNRKTRLPFRLARRYWGPGVLRIAGGRLRVEGLHHLDGDWPCFFASNHQSGIDVPALYAALPRPLHFILKEELRRMPFIGWFASAVGMVFVDRGARSKALQSLSRAGELIRSGRSVIAFPEGTRSPDGSLLPFKTGVFMAAIEAGVPVVPVAIDGAREVFLPGGFRPRPGEIRVTIGEPLDIRGLTQDDRSELARRVRESIEVLQARA